MLSMSIVDHMHLFGGALTIGCCLTTAIIIKSFKTVLYYVACSERGRMMVHTFILGDSSTPPTPTKINKP